MPRARAISEQRTLAGVEYDSKRAVTRRERVLRETDAAIPWAPPEALVASHNPKQGRGQRHLPPATMLRAYLLQQ